MGQILRNILPGYILSFISYLNLFFTTYQLDTFKNTAGDLMCILGRTKDFYFPIMYKSWQGLIKSLVPNLCLGVRQSVFDN